MSRDIGLPLAAWSLSWVRFPPFHHLRPIKEGTRRWARFACPQPSPVPVAHARSPIAPTVQRNTWRDIDPCCVWHPSSTLNKGSLKMGTSSFPAFFLLPGPPGLLAGVFRSSDGLPSRKTIHNQRRGSESLLSLSHICATDHRFDHLSPFLP